MNILIVVNPIAGGTNKTEILREVETTCKQGHFNCRTFKTKGENDLDQLTKMIRDYEPDRIISIGGDGTFLLVCKAARSRNIPIGIVPMGSANGMATELKVPADPVKALLAAFESQGTKELDMIEVNNHLMIHIGDIGTNAEIVKKYDQDPESGMAVYARYFLEVLADTVPFRTIVKTSNRNINCMAVMVTICNARTYGTGIPVNTISDVSDGLFEIVIFESVNIPALIKAGLASIDERFYSNQDSEVLQAKEAEIIFEEPRLLQLDGEVIGKYDQLKVAILPGVIKIVDQSG